MRPAATPQRVRTTTGPSALADGRVAAAVAHWTATPSLAALVAATGGPPTLPADPRARLAALHRHRQAAWDFRRGRERGDTPPPAVDAEVAADVDEAARQLGLRYAHPPAPGDDDVVVALGGRVAASVARLRYAARVAGGHAPLLVALGGFRRLSDDETAIARRLGLGDVTDEFTALTSAAQLVFPDAGLVRADGDGAEGDWGAWRTHLLATSDTGRLLVLAAPSRAPARRRANTGDAYEFLASHLGGLRGQRLRCVTHPIYRLYQHAVAVDELVAVHGATVTTVGVDPSTAATGAAGDLHWHHWLQEIGATVDGFQRIFRRLAADDAAPGPPRV